MGDDKGVCPLFYAIVKSHVRALMHLVTLELPEYGMQLVTTKCLNTAVMMLYLALGSEALKETRQCEVPLVRTKSSGSPALRSEVKSVLSTPGAPRTMWYVMITNGDMIPVGDRANDSKRAYPHFPGHVFIIEAPGPFLYQSYIRHYDLATAPHPPHMRGGGEELEEVLKGLQRVVGSRVWDAKCSEAWARLTHIPIDVASTWENMSPTPIALLPCYRKVQPSQCLGPLRAMVERGIEAAQSLQKLSPEKMSEPFTSLLPRVNPEEQHSGAAKDPFRPTNHPRPLPLTGKEMLQELLLIRGKLL